jgi:selenocysteine-specific elongation factor
VPLHRLQVFKRKQREGVVDRVVDACSVIGNKLFAKEADMNQFTNLKVEIGGVRGRIEGAFGKGGKFKAYFPDGLPAALTEEEKGKKKGPPAKILLKYKSYVFGAQERKKFVQNDK